MPQPYSCKSSAVQLDHPESLAKHPEFALKIALIAAHWQTVENELASIFTVLLGGYEGAALEIFHTLIDRNLRKQALVAVARDRLPPAMLDQAVRVKVVAAWIM